MRSGNRRFAQLKDIDLYDRAGRCGQKRKLRSPLCGYSLSNDANRTVAAGWATVKNTAPEFVNVKWHQQNEQTWAFVKSQGDRVQANEDASSIGDTYTIVPLTELAPVAAASSS